MSPGELSNQRRQLSLHHIYKFEMAVCVCVVLTGKQQAVGVQKWSREQVCQMNMIHTLCTGIAYSSFIK